MIAQKKFVVFAHFRTGSGLLCDLLNEHPAVLCGHEILDPFLSSHFKAKFFPVYMKGLLRRANTPVYGCGIKLHQLKQVHSQPEVFMTDLNQQGWQFVYLERRNLLRAAISNYIAAQHQRYFLRRDDDLELPITTIDPDKLLELLVWYQQINRQEAQIMATLPHIKLIYEEDLLHTSHHQPALDRIFEFLDIAPAQVRARSRRTSSDDIAGYVQNHEELLAFIAQTEFAEYLEGE